MFLTNPEYSSGFSPVTQIHTGQAFTLHHEVHFCCKCRAKNWAAKVMYQFAYLSFRAVRGISRFDSVRSFASLWMTTLRVVCRTPVAKLIHYRLPMPANLAALPLRVTQSFCCLPLGRAYAIDLFSTTPASNSGATGGTKP
jgi:hypothetical protein